VPAERATDELLRRSRGMTVDENVFLEHLDFSKEGTTDSFLMEAHHFFTRDVEDIASFIRSKGLISFPIIANYDLFQPLLSIHLLTSKHTCLRLPPVGEEKGYYLKMHASTSTYDDMGCCYDSMLDFGESMVVKSFLKHGRVLFKQGVLSLVPSNSISDWKFYGAPEEVDYKQMLTLPNAGIELHLLESFEPGSSVVHEIILPIVCGVQITDFLKLLTDEWESFQRCRDHLIYASIEIGNFGSASDRALRFQKLKKEIIDDGVHGLEDKLRALNRKGLLKAIGGVIGSASLFLSNLMVASNFDLLRSALAAAILGTSSCLNYIEYREGIKGVKGSPFYFLWKLTQKEQS
jgi:hypothetical protein